jgi:hypothetical protein
MLGVTLPHLGLGRFSRAFGRRPCIEGARQRVLWFFIRRDANGLVLPPARLHHGMVNQVAVALLISAHIIARLFSFEHNPPVRKY